MNLTLPTNVFSHFSNEIQPKPWRSLFEITLTLALLLTCLISFYITSHYSTLLPILLIIPTSLLFTRLFILQHDLGHGSLFKSKKANDFWGNILGALVITPYYYWRKSHMIHHASGGNLDKRPWIGDINVMTVNEYEQLSPSKKFLYRVSRNPLVMFFLGSIFIFMIDQRFYFNAKKSKTQFKKKEFYSVLMTNLVIILLSTIAIKFLGLRFFLEGILIPLWLGGVVGIYLFYVQHNFRDKYVASNEKWSIEDSALKGSSFYYLPQPLRWFTADIGYHHVHTFLPKIPFYHLKRAHENNEFFQVAPKFSLRHMRQLLSLKLFDESRGQMISWKEYYSCSAS